MLFLSRFCSQQIINRVDEKSMFHGRSKHIDIHYHFIMECVEEGQIVVEHVDSKDQRADIFTKALTHVKYGEMRRMIGVTDTEIGPV